MLNEFTYCPRLFYYEWVEGLFAHNLDTIEGAQRHEKIDGKTDPLPAPDDGEERFHARSVELTCDTLGIIAKIDIVEGSGDRATPVDYKRGAPRDTPEGPEPWPADRIQVAAQALVLRANGYTCDEAVLYYDRTRQRVRVPIDDALTAEATETLDRARATARSPRIPPPLVDSPKCPRCSLVGICLPDETEALGEIGAPGSRQLPLFPGDQDDLPLELVSETTDQPIRRLVPARDDLRPLYVNGNGLSIGRTSEVLRIREKGKVLQEVRLNEISHVSVFGNNQLTAAAIHGLCRLDKPIAHFSFGGWFYGVTQGIGLKNVFLRRDQFRRADEAAFCLAVARSIVSTKIRNQRTLLKRNHTEPPRLALAALKRLSEQALRAESLDELLGVEGNGARVYFAALPGMIKLEDETGRIEFDFRLRNRRPPRDPVNAMLSFAYSLLTRDLTIACSIVGFDPFMGFYHQPRFGRPALALDLMEGFRPLVADSAVLTAINTRMVQPHDFIRVGGAVVMTSGGRKGLIRAYEQRIDTLVSHPIFGYRVSYRRVFEIQARLMARVVTGEINALPGFETR
ncbi:CRISPR-associated endonuclease Cas1 [Candidatus Binatia bacterium]|nr:CRISPR-associated endonuclease Cas1 [Candidatus Binatia bacterium]